MIPGAVLPHSMGGIVGAVMLGLGRAMGETIAVALVIGSSPARSPPTSSRPATRCPPIIAFQWGEADGDVKRSALIAMGLTLFILTIVVNLVGHGDRQPGDAPECRERQRDRRRSRRVAASQRPLAARPGRAISGAAARAKNAAS